MNGPHDFQVDPTDDPDTKTVWLYGEQIEVPAHVADGLADFFRDYFGQSKQRAEEKLAALVLKLNEPYWLELHRIYGKRYARWRRRFGR